MKAAADSYDGTHESLFEMAIRKQWIIQLYRLEVKNRNCAKSR